MVEGGKMFSLINNSYRKVSSAWKNHCWDVKWRFYLNEVMPPAINHLVSLPWTLFSLGGCDWFLEVGKVYLHWSHSADLRLSAISWEFNHIYSDGFHTINGKLFQTLQILKFYLLFLKRTNRSAVFFCKGDSQKFQLKCLLFCSGEVMWDTGGDVWEFNLRVLTALEGRQRQIRFNLSLRPTAGPCCVLNWPLYLTTENAKEKEQ